MVKKIAQAFHTGNPPKKRKDYQNKNESGGSTQKKISGLIKEKNPPLLQKLENLSGPTTAEAALPEKNIFNRVGANAYEALHSLVSQARGNVAKKGVKIKV